MRSSFVRRCSSLITPSVPHVEVLLHGKASPVIVRNIYCIGRNYAEHARELGNAVPTEEPLIFMKSTASLRAPGDTGVIAFDEEFHHEVELVGLVGSHVKIGTLESGNELDALKALGLGLDLTRRGVQSELKKKGHPWTTAKSFAGSAVVGPLAPLDGTFDPDDLSFNLTVNGLERQSGHVNQMIFDVPTQLRYLNSFLDLLPGDLVFTGTPSGVGAFRKGDRFEMAFGEGSGPLKHRKTFHEKSSGRL